MSLTMPDVEQFHSFAVRSVHEGKARSFDDLYLLWQTERERENVNLQIKAGLDDVAAGRVQSVGDVNQELRSEFGFDE
ncbi:MAG: hypothetical protein O3A00_16660 [Planctomycetota bacterium]|nr:hypothetical protein [Planctomycetota bacterium]